MASITRSSSGLLTTRVFVGYDKNGKPVQKRVSAHTKKELNLLIQEAKANYVPRPNIVSLKSAYHMYISYRENILSKATIKLYKHYIIDSFENLMDKDINDITQEDIQKEVNRMSVSCSPKTIRNKLGLLNSVLKAYSGKPPYKINLPMRTKPNLFIPTEDIVKKLVEITDNTPLQIPIMFASYCGMRRGEIFALTYDDLDLENGIVSVTKSLGITEELTYEEKSPKSYAGYRDIDIPSVMLDKIIINKQKGKPLIELSVVQFSNRFDTLRNNFCEQLSIPKFRFHDLRHYYASVLVTLGIPDIYAIKLIGHSTTNFLRQNYQHIMNKQYENYRNMIKAKLT